MGEGIGGFKINLGSAGLAYTTDAGDQIISIKKSDYDKLSAENAALSERLREAIDWNEALEICVRDLLKWVDFSKTSTLLVMQIESCHKRARAYLSKTPKKDNT